MERCACCQRGTDDTRIIVAQVQPEATIRKGAPAAPDLDAQLISLARFPTATLRTLSLNLAAYHTQVEDMQMFNFLADPFGLLRVATNVDEATLQGVEADLRWRANQYVNLFAGVGLLDSEIDKYDGRPYTKGTKVPYAPDYTATAGVDFVVPMGNSGLSLIARLDASFTGETGFSAVQEESVVTEFGVPGDSRRRVAMRSL